MVKFAFDNVSIKGISTVVPTTEKNITDDKDLYNGNQKKIQRVINSSGFLKRRITQNETTSDLCLQAATDLIKNTKVNINEIDALLFISYTPDYLMPATAYVLHKKLGLSENCICMDIPQACSGYIIGLYQASMLINSGCKKVLLLVGDSFSKFNDMFIDKTAPIFGDAGSATLLEYKESADRVYFNINSNGAEYDALMCKNGGFRNPINENDFYENKNYKYCSKMDGGRIFDFTMNNITPNIQELLEFSNNNISQIDEFVFHQANKFILENIGVKLGVSNDKISTATLTEYGNQCGASIPCTISNIYRERFMKERKKCLLSGFGVGLSWASAIVTFDKIYCSAINNYKEV